MANQQKESYQHISPTYPQIPEIREENARQYLVGDIIGGFPFASGSFTDSGGFYLGRDSNDGLILLDLKESVPTRKICLLKRKSQSMSAAGRELERMILK